MKMTRKHKCTRHRKHKNRRGGSIFDGITSGWNNLTQKTKGLFGMGTTASTSNVPVVKPPVIVSAQEQQPPLPPPPLQQQYPPQQQYPQQPPPPLQQQYPPTSGGRRHRRKGYRGRGGHTGVKGHTESSLASNATTYTGGPTSQPHAWVGGKRRCSAKRRRSKRHH